MLLSAKLFCFCPPVCGWSGVPADPWFILFSRSLRCACSSCLFNSSISFIASFEWWPASEFSIASCPCTSCLVRGALNDIQGVSCFVKSVLHIMSDARCFEPFCLTLVIVYQSFIQSKPNLFRSRLHLFPDFPEKVIELIPLFCEKHRNPVNSGLILHF